MALFSGKAYEHHVVDVSDVALYLENTLDIVIQAVKVDQPKQLGEHGTDVESFAVL